MLIELFQSTSLYFSREVYISLSGSSVMWEESCESISVRHRRVSEVRTREDGASASDSEEEFVLIPEAGQQLLINNNYD